MKCFVTFESRNLIYMHIKYIVKLDYDVRAIRKSHKKKKKKLVADLENWCPRMMFVIMMSCKDDNKS